MQAPPTPPSTRPSRTGAVLLAVALVVAALVLGGGVWLVLNVRDGSGETTATATSSPAVQDTAPENAAPSDRVTYELRPQGGEPVRVELEVASTPEQRQLGLMHRTELAEGTGMVFLFPADDDGGFWMKNTLIPLSIAFVGQDGRVVSVHEMLPCTADPCPTYEPDGPYRYAVELPAGAFPEAGIGPGDEVVPLDPGALPTAS